MLNDILVVRGAAAKGLGTGPIISGLGTALTLVVCVASARADRTRR
ncbi:MAG: hypothetical protein NT029_05290 [Armatimonadetes bacterium]|nr:hypothetical protein [Armatimonadota bacterium]